MLGEPERVEVELANRLDTFTKSVSKIASTASTASYESHSVGRSSARGSQLSGVAGDTKRIELVVTDVQEAVDGTGITEMWQSGIVIDAQAGVTISSLYQGFSSQYAAINVNSGNISSLVTKTGVNSLGVGETLYSLIQQEAGKISLIVNSDNTLNSAKIILAINGNEGSSVEISADKVNLSGYVTASDLAATNAQITNLTSGVTTASHLDATRVTVDQFSVSSRGSMSLMGYTAEWTNKSVVTGVSLSTSGAFVYQTSSGTQHTRTGSLVTDVDYTTIYYLTHR